MTKLDGAKALSFIPPHAHVLNTSIIQARDVGSAPPSTLAQQLLQQQQGKAGSKAPAGERMGLNLLMALGRPHLGVRRACLPGGSMQRLPGARWAIWPVCATSASARP